jgi:hypothetical protein
MSFGQANYIMPDFSEAKHIGDVENNKISYQRIGEADYYAITAGDKPVCFIQTKIINIRGIDYNYLQNIFTEEEYRNKNLAKKLLFFLKNVEHKSFILGDKQSRLGQEFNKSLARSGRFPMFWLNTNTGEKHPYDYNLDNFTLAPYRSLEKPTEWVIMLEKTENNWMCRFLANSVQEGENYWERGIVWFD